MTSLEIAKVTSKKHKNILADIRKEMDDLGNEIAELIFGPGTYTNERGKVSPRGFSPSALSTS